MILKSLYHPLIPFQMSFRKRRLLCQRTVPVPHAVRLNISLTNHIQPILITQIIPFRIIRIMAGTHSVQIILLHNPDILNHPFTGYHITGQRIHFMPVSTFKQHRLPIHPYLSQILFQFNFPESYPLRNYLYHLASTFQNKIQCIKTGRLCTPFCRITDFKNSMNPPLRIRLHSFISYNLSLHIPQLQINTSTTPAHISRHIQRTVPISSIQIRNNKNILNMHPIPGI